MWFQAKGLGGWGVRVFIGLDWTPLAADKCSVAKNKHQTCFAQRQHGVRTAGSAKPLPIACFAMSQDLVEVVAFRRSWSRHPIVV